MSKKQSSAPAPPVERVRRFRRPSRTVVVGITFLLAAVSPTSIPTWRDSLLRAMGRILVVADPSENADIIVIAADAGREGILDAADLVHSGVATRVAVFSVPLHVAGRLQWGYAETCCLGSG